MATIEVDFDAFKALTNLRETEAMTYNDVVRKLLGLSKAAPIPAITEAAAWVWKGVTLPDGTELRAEYKGKAYSARVANGEWTQDGKTYSSPSAAAYAVTGSSVNGWTFWTVKRPGDGGWTPIGQLRK